MVSTTVIGCGNMGSALVRGLSGAGNHAVTAYDVDPDALEPLESLARTTTDLAEATADADVVVVAVKPDVVGAVLDELALSAEQTLVSIAAGVPTSFLERRTDAPVVRLMPNLAAESGNAAAAVTPPGVDGDVRSLLDDIGAFVEVDEDRMDVATALNGSGPAFAFYLLGAMQDAGVEGGLNPEQAETLAAQTFKGAAETVLRSDASVDELIDAVCSPGGTTIEGMAVLRESDAAEAVADAVAAAESRSEELSRGVDDE